MSKRYALVGASLLGAIIAQGDIVSYEGTSFPETQGWERITFCTPKRSLDNGCLVQHIGAPGECGPPPNGDQDLYSISLADFESEAEFFIEWRMETDGDRSEIFGVAPAVLVAGSLGITKYHFTIAKDQVRLIRDNLLPIVFIDIDPDVLHTYRLELYGDALYVWYIDGQVVDAGIPEGPYPFFSPSLIWGAESWFLGNETRWDYIRYGTIPVDASGDFDSDTDIDLRDFYFFQECVSNSGPGVDAGPGCRWADMDQDNDVDLHDFGLLQMAFTGGN